MVGFGERDRGQMKNKDKGRKWMWWFLGVLAALQLYFVRELLAAFALFAVGFAARPLGGVVFAHFGDRIGRKPIMVTTLVMMGASTTAIGLTPTFATIGVGAPMRLRSGRVGQKMNNMGPIGSGSWPFFLC